MDKLLLNVHEAARVLSVCPKTLKMWREQKKIPTLNIGKKMLFPVRDLLDFIEREKKNTDDL